MKILQVHSFFYPHVGGSEMYVLELSKHLVQRGHQVLVITSKLPGTVEHEYIEGIEVLRIDGHYFPKVPYFFFKPRLLKVLTHLAPQFDIIHSHVRFFLSTNCVALLRAIRKNVRFVLTLHATQPKTQIPALRYFEGIYEHTAGRFTVGAADAVIALDENVRKHAMLYGADARKIKLIPNAVDVTRFIPRTLKENEAHAPFQIGYLGNLVYRKGVHDLIQAVAEVPTTLNFQLKIIGEGPERSSLQDLCREHHIEQYVSFLGALDKNEIPDLLHKIDVLVLPSLSEGMPTVVLEAMAAGVPVIATDVGATRTLINSEDLGVLVPPQTPKAISLALSCLYFQEHTRQNIAKRARKHIEQRYSWEVVASQIEYVYQKVLHG